MNYFSEPEFDASGEYRLQKSASANNYYGGINAAYQQHKRHYGTIDRVYGDGNTCLSRPSYHHDPSAGPPKPERHFGPGIPSGGRSSVRGTAGTIYSPQRRGSDIVPTRQHPFSKFEYMAIKGGVCENRTIAECHIRHNWQVS